MYLFPEEPRKQRSKRLDRERYLSQREERIARQRAYYKANRADRLEYQQQYERRKKETRPGVCRAIRAARRAVSRRATPAWANRDAIAAFYGAARMRTAVTGIPHHVDHIVPLRGKNVCGLHVHHNLQVLPAKENLTKGNR